MTPPSDSLVAGSSDRHGRHENPSEGWDPAIRTAHGYDVDAGVRGRHAVTDAATEEAA